MFEHDLKFQDKYRTMVSQIPPYLKKLPVCEELYMTLSIYFWQPKLITSVEESEDWNVISKSLKYFFTITSNHDLDYNGAIDTK